MLLGFVYVVSHYSTLSWSTVNLQVVFSVVKRNICNAVVAILEIHQIIWVFLPNVKFFVNERFICLKEVCFCMKLFFEVTTFFAAL